VKRINGEARWKQHGRQKLQNKVTTGVTGEFINEETEQKRRDVTEERNKEEQLKEKKIHRKRIVEEKLEQR